MAGRKQHHIWQMLQRGFSDSKDHKIKHVWVYRNDQSARQTQTKKYCVIANFYGDEGSRADANITNFENKIQALIHRVRKGQDGDALEANIVAPYLAHFELRSLFLRSEMFRIGGDIGGFLKNEVATPRGILKLIQAELRKPNSLNKLLDGMDLSEADRGMGEIYFESESQRLGKHISEEILAFAQVLALKTEYNLCETVKGSHLKSLEQDFSEAERSEFHRKLNYTVIRSDGKFILPDTCVAFFKAKGFGPVSMKGDRIEAVIAPVSTDAAILGLAKGAYRREVEVFVKALVSCAFESCLYDRYCSNMARLAQRIGRKARIVSQADMARELRLDDLISDL